MNYKTKISLRTKIYKNLHDNLLKSEISNLNKKNRTLFRSYCRQRVQKCTDDNEVLANSGHAKLWPSINSNGQSGQLLDREEWTFNNMPLDSEQHLQDLTTEMTLPNFVEHEKFVRQFKHLN
jgi:hypothetical protein